MKHVSIQESMSRLSAETVLSRIECKHRPSPAPSDICPGEISAAHSVILSCAGQQCAGSDDGSGPSGQLQSTRHCVSILILSLQSIYNFLG